MPAGRTGPGGGRLTGYGGPAPGAAGRVPRGVPRDGRLAGPARPAVPADGPAAGPARPAVPADGPAAGPEEGHKGPREACGIFGIWGHPAAVECTLRGLYALQHRGQESAGIAVLDRQGRLRVHKGAGLVGSVFAGPDRLGPVGAGAAAAIGHVRYATTGDPGPRNAQPLLFAETDPGAPIAFALAHNGQLAGGLRWRAVLQRLGATFVTSADSEVIGRIGQRLAAQAVRRGGTNPPGEPPAPLLRALAAVPGAYAVVILTPEGLLAARDPWGIRPLVLGRIDGAWAVASETCALETAGGRAEGEVPPGFWVWITNSGANPGANTGLGSGVNSGTPSGVGSGVRVTWGALPGWSRAGLSREAFCVFEYIYFARPDSCFGGRSVYEVRKELGRRLALTHPAPADVVVGVPDSSLPAAAGYAEAAGLPHELGLVKNRYTGRTFIRPGQRAREEAVRLKLHPVPGVLDGRRVVLVDDSLVRGTTARWLVSALREAGAREVHLRITAPPYRYPCHFGVDTGRVEELLAAGRSPASMARAVGADSLAFLPLDQVVAATGRPGASLCLGCFTGRYPLDPEGKIRPAEGRAPVTAAEGIATEERRGTG